MNDRIEEIRRREENATRGPWTWDGHRVPTLSGRAGDPDIYEYDTEVIEASHWGECACRSSCTLNLEVGPNDRAFIAHARDDIAYLLAELDKARAGLAEAWDEGRDAAHAELARMYSSQCEDDCDCNEPIRNPYKEPVE